VRVRLKADEIVLAGIAMEALRGDHAVRRTVELTEQPSTRAEITAISLALLI
jgi:hypothetical protein